MTFPNGWSPVRIDWDTAPEVVDWAYTEGYEFTDPNFGQTVWRCFREPARLLFRRRTTIDELGSDASPAGVVFHMSRCGSTLVAQMLAAVSSNVVIAEAQPVDAVVRSDAGLFEKTGWLRGLVSAWAQPGRSMVLKADAWHALDLAIFRAAFPDAPFVFVYRDPVEVLVSHEVQRGAHMVPGAVFPPEPGLSVTEFGARVLARICEAVLDTADDNMRFVDHAALPAYVVDELAGAWGLDDSSAARAAMLAIAANHAKNPSLPYDDDRVEKQARASAEVREAAERWLVPLYKRFGSPTMAP